MAGDMKGFVPDEIIPGATVQLLLQNPGADEEKSGRPAVGKSGQMMDTKFLPLAGLERGLNVNVANVLKCRWVINGKRTNDLPPASILKPAVAHCTKAYLRIPSETKLVIGLGKLANDYLGCPGSISSWRGFTYPVTADYAQA